MKSLIRIDKGYVLLRKVKNKYEKEKVVPELLLIEKKQKFLKVKEEELRNEIDEIRNSLRTDGQQSKFLNVKSLNIAEEIHSGTDSETAKKLKAEEKRINKDKGLIVTHMVEKFSVIDIKRNELEKLQNSMRLLSLQAKPYIKIIGVKEQKILEDIKKIEKKIRVLRKDVDNEVLKQYDKKRISMGRVFYPVRDFKCSYCNTEIDVEKIDDDELFECPECGRYLFMEENKGKKNE